MMQHYQKPPLDIPAQIQKLKQRGLVIDDETRAASYLTRIGFYRLSAYFIPFEDLTNAAVEHAFLRDTHFDQILNLYIFDRKLRLLLLESFERLEVAIRGLWSNALTMETGDAHAYMRSEYFSSYREHLKQLNKAATDLAESNEAFVKHYQQKYNEPALPPTWAMVETLTLSALSRWYKNTGSNRVKTQVADALGIRTVALMDSILEAITVVRNTAAHHSRCWNRRFIKPLPNIKNLSQSLQATQAGRLDNHLYNYLVVITHMMKAIHPSTSWQTRLTRELLTLQTHQQRAMGFPENWQTMLFWQDAVTVATSQYRQPQA